jgi:hypothetical protein
MGKRGCATDMLAKLPLITPEREDWVPRPCLE